jgi:hypothetical protein
MFTRLLAAVPAYVTWLAVVVTSIALVGCSPSTKNESQYWENHKQSVKEYGTKWPGFKGVLDERMKKAEPIWDAAQKLSDDKAKAQKMQEANETLKGLVGKLDEVKYKSEGIVGTVGKINGLKLPKSQASDRRDAVDAANKVLSGVESAMQAAAPKTDQEAIAILDEQISKLISGQGAADRALTSLQPSKPAKPKKGK